MTTIFEAILRRRSIRRYTPEPVSDGMLTQLLEAAMAAPSACNSQPWEFVVVSDAEKLAVLRSKLFFGRYRAPAAILVLGNQKIAHNPCARQFWVQDCSAATENILLAAAGAGLGAVWIGIYPLAGPMKALAELFSLPPEAVPFSLVYVGRPAEEKRPRTQYAEYRVHWQHYQPRKRRARVKNAKLLD